MFTLATDCCRVLKYSYLTERKILDGVSFVVPAGKSVAIVGTSGSGKALVCHESLMLVVIFFKIYFSKYKIHFFTRRLVYTFPFTVLFHLLLALIYSNT